MFGKKVSFNLLNNEIYKTYSSEEYDRGQIDHVIYRKSYNRISNDDLNIIFITLDIYKLYEMVVHKESLKNNSYSKNIYKIHNN